MKRLAWLLLAPIAAYSCAEAGGAVGDGSNLDASVGGNSTGGSNSGGAASSAATGGTGTIIEEDATAPIDDAGFDACSGTEQTAITELLPVDIIWVVDNSVSMRPAIEEMTRGFQNFVNVIANSNIDYRVIMLSLRGQGELTVGSGTRFAVCIPAPLGGPNCADNPPIYYQSNIDILSTQPLEQFLGTLGQTTGYTANDRRGGDPWEQWLRPNATKTIVTITDDESRFSADEYEHFPGGANPAAGSVTLPEGILEPRWNGIFDGYLFHALYGWGSDTNPAATCTYPNGSLPPASGETYTELVRRTGGVRAKICDGASAWGPFFDSVAQAVVTTSKLNCEINIPPPSTGTLDPAKVNVVVKSGADEALVYKVANATDCDATLGGWYYDNDAAPSQVILCETSCNDAQQKVQSSAGATISVQFGCETQVIVH